MGSQRTNVGFLLIPEWSTGSGILLTINDSELITLEHPLGLAERLLLL